MIKNIIIAGLVLWSLVLTIALAYVLMNWQPASKATTSAQRSTPTDDARIETPTHEFTFKAGVHLAGNIAPPAVGRALTIIAAFDAQQKDGVIIAHGGAGHGYALYIQEAELFFALRRETVLTTVSGGKVGEGRHTVTAALTKTGELRVTLDGHPPAVGQAAGTITSAPSDGLDVGADRGAAVGPYAPPNPFGGTIEFVTLKTSL
jgi:hypothetical protein